MIKKITFLGMLLIATTFFAQITINSEDFESGTFTGTQWNDGGTYCELVSNSLPNNNYAIKLNSGGANATYSVYSNSFDLIGYTSVDIYFDFQTTDYNGDDDFYLEYSIDGSNWLKFPTNGFNIDADVLFTNNTKYTQQKVSITATFSATTSFRFRSSASGNDVNAFLFIDNILIQAFGPNPPSPSVESISSGDVWRYLDDGSNLGTAWTAISYDDSSWDYGASELGYGDGDEATNIGTPSDPKPITTYFRKEFSIADKSIYNSLDLEAVRDDGMVVYLNDTQIWRDGVDETFTYSTLANQTIGGDDESAWITKNMASTLLINGINVIAVEIHQVNTTSSDISFNFKLTPSDLPVGAATVVRGPYLQTGTPTSVIVKWRTNNATESVVNYGTSLGALNNTVLDLTSTTEHEVTLSGLNPNTKYYYEIADATYILVPQESEMFVKTSPPHGTKQFVRMWALGDAGTEGQTSYAGQQKAVRDAYYNYVANAGSNPGQTDMMLFLGDNAYDNGSDADFQRGFFNGFAPILKNTVAWSCLGNHETYSVGGASNASASPYYDIFTFPKAAEAGGTASGTEAYYSYDYANIHFIVLESMSLYNDATQMNWVTNDINNTNQDWIIAYFHHPPYTKGSHNSDTETELIAMRQNFLSILEDGGVDLILNGHSHSYERSYFINGHYGNSDSFDAALHTVGINGDKSGKADTTDGAYSKTATDNEGAVYVVTGSAGKISGFNQDGFHEAMYFNKNQLGSSVIEIESDGNNGQNLNLKFVESTELITDYFTIHKTGITLSANNLDKDNNLIKLYPVPANSFLNIDLKSNENLRKVSFYNTIGNLVKETEKQQINIGNLKTGMYMVVIETDQNNYYKSIIVE
ncbi:metallophosphoesterase [Lutibacter sp.]|uniref:metallophosphoesterase n=1 Tax=Lutibacter sp. TaxID=1925666 RepID=UPI00356A287D